MSKFNARDIPNRAHYDRVMTWATTVFGRLDGPTIAGLQEYVAQKAARQAATPGNDDERIRAVLAEIGFCAVIDHMADIIEGEDGTPC